MFMLLLAHLGGHLVLHLTIYDIGLTYLVAFHR